MQIFVKGILWPAMVAGLISIMPCTSTAAPCVGRSMTPGEELRPAQSSVSYPARDQVIQAAAQTKTQVPAAGTCIPGDISHVLRIPASLIPEPAQEHETCPSLNTRSQAGLQSPGEVSSPDPAWSPPHLKLRSPPNYPIVMIERTDGSFQGHCECLSITIEDSSIQIGGFDFLIEYPTGGLTAFEATPGQMMEDCEWEYFTYRLTAGGDRKGYRASGYLRIIAIAETNNGNNHPSCFGPPSTDPYELTRMHFLVTDDRRYECTYIPVSFYWLDCGDNSLSSADGYSLYIDRAIYNAAGVLLWDEEDDLQFPESMRPPNLGAPDYCLNPDPEKPTAVRLIDFINGGVDIICADSIDARGDINLNEVAYEVADAVLFANYFVYGLLVFALNTEGQIAATDVNGDGVALSPADLVYLIRVIIGAADPVPKPAGEVLPVQASIAEGVLKVESDVDLGAAFVIAEGAATPVLLADNMDLHHNFDGTNTRILVYSPEGNSFSGEFLKIDRQVLSVEMATAEGNPVAVDLLPRQFALHQNYPNPFNAVTTVAFDLEEQTDYTVTIYNVNGQRVRAFCGTAERGRNTITWDATACASGVYFYRLETSTYADTKKMVLLK